jgi:hypothetical protein
MRRLAGEQSDQGDKIKRFHGDLLERWLEDAWTMVGHAFH